MAQDLPDSAVAREMASRQREISVSEFFLKNRHLLGFDSGAKAMLTTVKEAVDNALDACEDAGILPEIRVEIVRLDDGLFEVTVEDNGPGIVEDQIGRIFGKLLYGSKFHKLSQSRGQQGMGISAAGMYAQLTTGRALHVISRIQGETAATELHVSIDTAKNRPDLHRKRQIPWDRPHGTRVTAAIEGHYQKGAHSVDMYLKLTAIVNPHVQIHFLDPSGRESAFHRSTESLPPRPVEIRPHPRGVELGQLIQMLHHTENRTLLRFLENEFSRVGRKTALAIIEKAGGRLTERSLPKRIAHVQARALYRAIEEVPVTAPRTDCLVPIGEERLREGLRKEIDADFFHVITRPAAVYRGNPFQVEVGIAYGLPGGKAFELTEGGRIRKANRRETESGGGPSMRADDPVHLLRFANRVPLLYDPAGCAITRAVVQTNWTNYGVRQAKGALPLAPMAILVHVASVWVPFTSEAKEAVASYPAIVKEIKLGIRQCGRKLARYLARNRRLEDEFDKRTHIELYLPHVGEALQEILELSDDEREDTVARLGGLLRESRKI